MLTHLTLFDLLRRNLKNMENLNHDLNDCVHHLRGRRQFCIDLETPEKRLNTFKDVDKSVSACLNILCCLRDESVTIHTVTKLARILTERRIPIPANMTFAGENTCQMSMRLQISDNFMS